MGPNQTALLFFYGIFWAVALGSIAAFRPFETTSFFIGRRVNCLVRFLICIIVANFCPVLGLWGLYNSVLCTLPGSSGIPFVAVASMSLFSIPRILHAIILNKSTANYFYTNEELERVKLNGKLPSPFYYHLIPGLLYLIIFLGIAFGYAYLLA